MNIHKSSRLTPIQRKEICSRYYDDRAKVSYLADEYHVTRPTIYKIINRGREKDFSLHKSTNARYRCLEWGIRRLAKVEKELEDKLKKEARRYNKNYPGQMIHMDTKRLPLLEGETPTKAREYLFVAIDDFSRELFTAIMPDKTSVSARRFLDQVIQETAYTIETVYTDNGREYKGDPKIHSFMLGCQESSIEQKFTRPKTPRTNGKAERVIRTLMAMWHDKTKFNSSAHRKNELKRFVNYYNWVKPHKGIDGMTPGEKLIDYFYPDSV
jgi:transposase InsO family protein